MTRTRLRLHRAPRGDSGHACIWSSYGLGDCPAEHHRLEEMPGAWVTGWLAYLQARGTARYSRGVDREARSVDQPVLSRSPCSNNSNASTAIQAATHPGRAQLLHPSAVNGCRSASCLARSPMSRNCTASSHTSTRALLSSGPPNAGSRRSETGSGDVTPAGKGEQPPTAATTLNQRGRPVQYRQRCDRGQ